MVPATGLKTVLILGASYAGYPASHLLAQKLPPAWRVIVIERNTHFNHLYIFPRMGVVYGHEHKAFIPYWNMFKLDATTDDQHRQDPSRHILIHGHVKRIHEHSVEYTPIGNMSTPIQGELQKIKYDYLIYALGSHPPAPINFWSNTSITSDGRRVKSLAAESTSKLDTGLETPPSSRSPSASPERLVVELDSLSIRDPAASTTDSSTEPHGTKPEGRHWLQEMQGTVSNSKSVCVIGGGPLGVQYATDIASAYPTKNVTLVHSGTQLLPRFDEFLHKEAIKRLGELGVTVMLSSRVDLASKTPHSIRTLDGRLIQADLILLCTGQRANTNLLSSLAPNSINPRTGMVSVLRSMQLAAPRPISPEASSSTAQTPLSDTTELETVHPHIFVVGDSADAFGALNAGHTAWAQALLASRNILMLIKTEGRARLPSMEAREEEQDSNDQGRLEAYEPPSPAIKVTLGLDHAVHQNEGKLGISGPDECEIDLAAPKMWEFWGVSTEDMTL